MLEDVTADQEGEKRDPHEGNGRDRRPHLPLSSGYPSAFV